MRHLRRVVPSQDWTGKTDGQLVESFIDHKDEAAFATLVSRHGPMVLSVCRRLVRNHHDAEDAFQATFLVLARKASSIRPRAMVANWLHGVAYRTALKARTMTAKRQVREKQVAEMPEPEAAHQDPWHELTPLLDQELSGLPETYRLPILLCDLEGKTIKEATQQLGWPQGTLAGRLARGRKMLAKRLVNRGAVLSGGSLAVLLAQSMASASLPTALLSSTVKLIVAGQAAAVGMVPVKVAALTEGVLKAMLLTKLKTVTAVLLVVGMVAFGGGLLQQQSATGQQTNAGQQNPKPTNRQAAPPAPALREEAVPGIPAQRTSVAFSGEEDRKGPADYGAIFEKTLTVVRDYFQIDYASRYDGRIETFPALVKAASTPSIRRRAVVWIVPAGDGSYSVQVSVFKEAEKKAPIWEPIGRDNELEQVILKRLASQQIKVEREGESVPQTIVIAPTSDRIPPKDNVNLPRGTAPTQALVTLSSDKGHIGVRTRGYHYEPVTTVMEGRPPVTSYTLNETVTTNVYDCDAVQVFDVKGKRVDVKQLPRLLKEETVALVVQGGGPVDPLHLRLLKVGTLLFVLPPLPPLSPPPPLPLAAPQAKDVQIPEAPIALPAVPAVRQSSEQEVANLREQVQNLERRLAAREAKASVEADPKEKSPDRIGTIFVKGNNKIPTAAILKKIRIYPGQVLDYPALLAAEKDLSGLVTATITAIEKADGASFVDILVTVKEK
jgi:RNA polymerase sigma factor (sigma-70 family)